MDDVGLVKAPRICKMEREDNGYGFNLHGEKGVVGQYISAVDPGGSADRSGLCVGDRVVEVNGINVEAMSHGEVVSQIRSDPVQATLLVVDKITDSYLKKINRPVTSSLASYSSVHEIKISNTEQLAALRVSGTVDNVDGDDTGAEDDSQNDQPNVSNDETDQVDKVDEIETPSPPPYTKCVEPPSLPEVEPPVTPPVPQPPQEKESLEEPETTQSVSNGTVPDEKQESHIVQNGTGKTHHTETNEHTPKKTSSSSSLKWVDRPTSEWAAVRGNSDPSSQISKKEESPKKPKEKKSTASFKTTPKRKEVKQSTTDWKSKLNMFDNL